MTVVEILIGLGAVIVIVALIWDSRNHPDIWRDKED